MALPTSGQFSSSRTSPQLTVDDLLSVARQQGGAVAEVAEELTNPKRSMLSTIGDGFKKSFGSFVDVMGMPNQVVAGVLSSDLTIGEAIHQNVNVSELFLGEQEKDMTRTQKVGSFITRTAIDVLFDPLTYLTFGASRGILGVSAARTAFAGEKTAETLGLKNIGDKFALSEKGEELADTYIQSQRKGLRHTWRIDQKKKLIDSGVTDMDEITKRLDDLETKTTDDMVAKSLNARLSPSFAVQAVSNLIEKNPALIETLVDKGGVKFFGKSILSGQRIRAVSQLIPGVTLLDNLTQPVRNAFGTVFSRNYTLNGRLPDEFIQMDQKFRDMADSMNNDLLQRAGSLFRELGITKNEAEFISAAVESNLTPRDPRSAEIWRTLNGFEPDMTAIRPEVWTAAGFTKSQFTKNLKLMRAAGIPVANHANYFPHLLVKQPMKSLKFRTPPSQVVNRAKFAGISAFVDEAGERIVGFSEKDGNGDLLLNVPGDATKSLKQTGVDVFEDVDGKTLTRARASIKEAKDLGVDFEDNALTVMLLASMEATKSAITRNFIKDVGEKMGKVASQAPGGYRAVGVTGLKHEGEDISSFLVGDTGEQLMFHPDVAKRLEEFAGSLGADEGTETVLKNYDKLQNLFKATVTSIFPAFHGRNAISNVMLHFLDIGYNSLNPAKHVAAANLIGMEHKFAKLQTKIDAGKAKPDEMFEMMNKTVLKDKTGYEWSFAELRKVIRDNVVAFNPRNLGQIDQVQFGVDDVKEISNKLFPTTKGEKVAQFVGKMNPFSTKNLAVKTGFKVGSLVEDQSRLVSFLTNLEKTGDVQLAAQRTKQFLFDYQNLSEFERRVLRRIIPFYTFSRKNMELQVRTLFSKPGRIAGEIRAVQTIGDALGAGNLTEEEKQKLPDWMQNGLNALVERDGSHITVLSSIGSPIEQIFQQVQPNQALASVSPLIRLPVELMSGYSFFHGKSISEVTNAATFKDAPQVIKDFIGFTEVNGETASGEKFKYYASLRPARMHTILSLPPTSRVLSSLRQMQNEEVSEQFKIMQFLFGVRPYEFNLEIEAQRREKELREEMENVLDSANVGYSFTRFVLPKDDKELK